MPPAVNNNANNAAIHAAAKAEREEKLRGALKKFIISERQRKKEELEAKIEEERIQKEREARERENDLLLEDTRGQITKLDQKLTDLRNEKQQLFLQLKKVLNDDETRKKQQKDNELFALQMQAKQTAVAPPPQVFLPPVHLQPHQMPVLPKPIANQPVKRGRSPSPPAHQAYYKSTNYTQPKHDDRRGAEYARVLWNKPPTQYQNPTLFYQASPNGPPPPQPADGRGPPIIYPGYNLPLRPAYHMELQPAPTVAVSKAGDSATPKFTQVYHINLDQPPISQAGPMPAGGQAQKPQVTMEKIGDRYHHVEVKHEGPPGHGPPPPHGLPEGVVYSPLIPGMPLHANVMQITGNPGQNPKGGASITQGYAPRGSVSAHEQQMARQQQLTVIPGQPGQPQPSPQQYSYSRHIY